VGTHHGAVGNIRECMNCKARLVTAGNEVVSVRQPEHTHSSNEATALAFKAAKTLKVKGLDIYMLPLTRT